MRKIKISFVFWTLLFIIQFIFLCIYEYQHYYSILNSDFAADLILAKTMAQEGKWFFCDDFFYTTEVRILHTQLLQSLLFRFTDNFKFVFLLSFGVFMALNSIVCYLICYLLSKEPLTALWGCILLITPNGEFWSVCFETQAYSVYLLSIYLFFFLFLKSKKTNKKIYFFFLSTLSYLVGCGGIRFFQLVFIPLALVIFVRIMRSYSTDGVFKIKLCREEILSLLFAFAGFVTFVLIRDRYSVGVGEGIILDFAQSLDRILYIPMALLEAFGSGGYYIGYNIVSLEGICFCIVFLAVCLFYRYYFQMFNKTEKLSDDLKFARDMSIYAVLISLFVMSFTSFGGDEGERFRIRYLVIAMYFFIPLTVIMIAREKRLIFRYVVCGVIMLYILICDKRYWENKIADCPAYVYALQSEGVGFGWSTNYWNANYITALTDDKVQIATINPEDDYQFFEWGTRKSYMSRTPEFVILSNEEFLLFSNTGDAKADDIIYKDDKITILGLN